MSTPKKRTSEEPAGERPLRDKPFQGKPCPICGKPAVEKYRPFCSARCADIDLHRWLSGSYAIPASEDEDEDGDEAPLAPDGGR